MSGKRGITREIKHKDILKGAYRSVSYYHLDRSTKVKKILKLKLIGHSKQIQLIVL